MIKETLTKFRKGKLLRKYSIRIDEITETGIRGIDYAIISKEQCLDIIAIASVTAEDYEPLNLYERFFVDN